ncbi:hypothetical protein JTB14_030630 [Gonioctena quinquepunctata]|nr:hypothetical protein JTB14_030630 [Gonioctena quinquepunctata]
MAELVVMNIASPTMKTEKVISKNSNNRNKEDHPAFSYLPGYLKYSISEKNDAKKVHQRYTSQESYTVSNILDQGVLGEMRAFKNVLKKSGRSEIAPTPDHIV